MKNVFLSSHIRENRKRTIKNIQRLSQITERRQRKQYRNTENQEDQTDNLKKEVIKLDSIISVLDIYVFNFLQYTDHISILFLYC
jgi:hypothetical protein